VGTIKTADQGNVWLYGCRSESVGAGLGCCLGCMPAMSVSHSVDAAAVCGSWRCINAMLCLCLLAIGCRDPEPPKYGWVVRESDGVWMGCNFSNHHWRLTCDGVRWIGQYENCSSGK